MMRHRKERNNRFYDRIYLNDKESERRRRRKKEKRKKKLNKINK